MNRSWLLVVAALYFIAGCKERPLKNGDPQYIKSLQAVRLSPLVDSLFKTYAKTVNSNNGYAMYVDLKTAGKEYMITFAPFTKKVDNLNSTGAVNYFMLNDSIPVVIYTGLEDFIVRDTAVKGQATFNPNVDFTLAWSYVHLDDTSYIVRGNSAPFLNITLRPTIIWHAPDNLK